jgi:hypothetical protein
MTTPRIEDLDVDALEQLERTHGYKIDVIMFDGTHRYWSTHCRHTKDADDAGHKACSADKMGGVAVYGRRRHATIERKPAQCKSCAAPCVCPCHTAVSSG